MDTYQIKDFCISAGATMVGIAGVESFVGAPEGHRPRDFIDSAESVIVIGVKIPSPLLSWPEFFQDSEIIQNDEKQLELGKHVYSRCGYSVINDFLEELALRLALRLEACGHRSIYLPATYGSSLIENFKFFGPFSHRHAAVRAGLGEFGYSGLVLTPDYGPRVRFISVITSAGPESDPPIGEPICLREECGRCLEECGGGALNIREGTDSDQIFFDPPVAIDSRLCYRSQGKANCTGRCIQVCPIK